MKLMVFPNPYIRITNINYNLKSKTDVLLEVYDVSGKRVVTLVNGSQGKGEYNYPFSSSDYGFSPGLYIVKLKVNESQHIQKIIEIR